MNYRENPQGISQNSESQIYFANYVIDSCNHFMSNNRLTLDQIKWIKYEVFRYQYVLVKQGLISPRLLIENFRWNSNIQIYKIMLQLPLILLLRYIKTNLKSI